MAPTSTIPAKKNLARPRSPASLLHDDVVDHSISRRLCPSANVELGNSTAVLGGDYLLGLEIVRRRDGVEQTGSLAKGYRRQAIAALGAFRHSEAEQGLVEMAQLMLQR
ncbi:hypothetical protein PpBr36_05278 [Pyricularia pennisetigena]|uniref:hypothetical protein n=1 Tax=Pyricularia pennisetigena TaxID=1578925 RepID=UPI00114F71C1|nr:hypothetical protein PpBr36_05278 [Pyricularia pennisetigena]TLS26205.1 hypothetical protein PpBr36_05278 [Pyricularia pennisetigena]